jgi:hypothetical protein
MEEGMNRSTTLQDLIGIEDIKLGFFQEVQTKVEELKHSNRELRKKQEEIQAILDGIVDVMVVLSEDLRIISVNHVFFEVFGKRDPQGDLCFEVLRGRSEPCPDCPVLLALRDNEVKRDETSFRIGDRNKHFEILASPLQFSEESLRRVLLFKRDVTLEREMQAQYLQAEKMATVGVLAAGVAHEINNPLTAISGFSQGLRKRLPRIEEQVDGDVFTDFQEYLETILKECSRCQEIVQTLLTFSRPTNSRFTRINLNELILDCLKILRYRLKKSPGVVLKPELDKRLHWFHGDEAQLKQVVLNLVTNALDAVDEHGRITIRTSRGPQGQVSLVVEDDGAGIPREDLERLFDPFFTTKPVGQGTGIGLSTCYTIVQGHGGQIFVCSDEGKGTSFCVTLPGQEEDHG